MAHTYTCIYTPDTGARIYIRKIFNKSFYLYILKKQPIVPKIFIK